VNGRRRPRLDPDGVAVLQPDQPEQVAGKRRLARAPFAPARRPVGRRRAAVFEEWPGALSGPCRAMDDPLTEVWGTAADRQVVVEDVQSTVGDGDLPDPTGASDAGASVRMIPAVRPVRQFRIIVLVF